MYHEITSNDTCIEFMDGASHDMGVSAWKLSTLCLGFDSTSRMQMIFGDCPQYFSETDQSTYQRLSIVLLRD